MNSALHQKLESALRARAASFCEKPPAETISTGIPVVDSECGGLPRGAITEIVGPASSGRTTLLHSILAEATGRGESCALVDASDAFDPESAARAGVDLQRLLWIRCAAHKPKALAVTNLLLQNGGWGVIALDVADLDPKDARRIPLNAWYRFRRAVENKPTAFLVLGQEPYAGSCAARILETEQSNAGFEGLLFRGSVFRVSRRKPPGGSAASFEATAWSDAAWGSRLRS